MDIDVHCATSAISAMACDERKKAELCWLFSTSALRRRQVAKQPSALVNSPLMSWEKLHSSMASELHTEWFRLPLEGVLKINRSGQFSGQQLQREWMEGLQKLSYLWEAVRDLMNFYADPHHHRLLDGHLNFLLVAFARLSPLEASQLSHLGEITPTVSKWWHGRFQDSGAVEWTFSLISDTYKSFLSLNGANEHPEFSRIGTLIYEKMLTNLQFPPQRPFHR
jgi:hypothetical protein